MREVGLGGLRWERLREVGGSFVMNMSGWVWYGLVVCSGRGLVRLSEVG